jgi:hypothetical protein
MQELARLNLVLALAPLTQTVLQVRRAMLVFARPALARTLTVILI